MNDTPQEGQARASLAERLRNRDPVAEEEFVAAYSERVLLMMAVRTRNPETARELTQEVLFSVWRALCDGRVKKEESLGAYVHGTARNLASNYLRSEGKRRDEVPFSDAHAATYPAEPADSLDRRRLLRLVLRRLKDIDRKILLLTLVDGLKPGEVAARLGLKAEVVRARKSRALKKVVEAGRRMSRT